MVWTFKSSLTVFIAEGGSLFLIYLLFYFRNDFSFCGLIKFLEKLVIKLFLIFFLNFRFKKMKVITFILRTSKLILIQQLINVDTFRLLLVLHED